MFKATVTLENMEGFDAQIVEVIRAVNSNLSETADFVLSEAKTTSLFADKTGNLRKSLKKKISRYEDGGYLVLSKAPHAHLVEFGHEMVTSKGQATGKRVPPHPFLRTATEKGIRRAVELFRASK